MHEPFHSPTPDNPMLDPLRRRHKVRIEAQRQKGVDNMAERVSLAERVGEHQAFGANVRVTQYDLPLGTRPEDGESDPSPTR